MRFYFITICTRSRTPLFGELVETSPRERLRPRTIYRRDNSSTPRTIAAVALSPLGNLVETAWASLHSVFPDVTASNKCVMPDHFHGVLIFKGYGTSTLETVLGHFMGQVDSGIWESRKPYVITPFDGNALANVRRYIRNNPNRAMWKRKHPGLFLRIEGIRHPCLPTEAVWTGLGNILALASPFHELMRITYHKPLDELGTEIAHFERLAREGHVLISGFISPAERKVFETLRAEHLGPYIRLLPFGIPRNYDPSLEYSREIAEDGAMLLSPFSESVAWGKTTRENCRVMNEIGSRIR